MADKLEHKYIRNQNGALINTDDDDLQRYKREIALSVETKETREKVDKLEEKLDLILQRLSSNDS